MTRGTVPRKHAPGQVDATLALATLLGLLVVAGCAPTVERPQTPPKPSPSVGLATDSLRYVLTPGPYGPETRIVATFRAPADTTAWILHCNGAIAWGLQRQVEGAWRDAWVAMTNSCLSPAFVVRGDSAFVDTLVFTPSAGAVIDSAGFGPGTYRVAMYDVLTSFDPEARPFGPDLPIERRVSAPITLVDPARP